MRCRICGEFSSALICYQCSTQPATIKLTLLEAKLREYLAESSIDGWPIRQKMRQELKEMVNYGTGNR